MEYIENWMGKGKVKIINTAWLLPSRFGGFVCPLISPLLLLSTSAPLHQAEDHGTVARGDRGVGSEGAVAV